MVFACIALVWEAWDDPASPMTPGEIQWENRDEYWDNQFRRLPADVRQEGQLKLLTLHEYEF